ncbi:MAG: alkaline phosphatase family protein [Polyangiaceae bacterium]|nr:alkaline phosphatase family protein [Polyangiaceae bacterium]
MPRWRALALVLLTAALAALHVVGVVRVALPPPPPAELAPVAAGHPPLARRLVLVIVDGLRYDFGTDPSIVPQFAAEMRARSSAMVIAGPVSMTSSAVLAYATGQPGDLDQVVENETAHATRWNHLFANARAAGLRLAAAGDMAWFTLIPASVWDLAHPDPQGLAIDVDYNDEILGAAYEFLRADPLPDFMIFHFVSPDHQGHAHGVHSEAYRRHIREFDDKLGRLLAALPADATVFVTSDHGAADDGKHGSDTPLMRRSPLYAYGPGIVAGLHPDEPIDQLDLAATFAHLLGVPSPAHGEGHVLARWLDVPPETRAAIACGELERLGRYARAELGAEAAGLESSCPDADPEARVDAARARATALAGRLVEAQPADSPAAWLMMAVTVGAGLLLAYAWTVGLAARTDEGAPGPRFVPSLGVALALVAVAVVLTRSVENLPGTWPNGVRIALLAAGNVAMAVTFALPRRFFAAVDRRAPELGVLVVGVLAATHARHTLAECFVLVAGSALVVLVWAWRRRRTPERAPLSVGRAVLGLACAVAIWPIGIREGDYWSPWLTGSRAAGLAGVLGLMALFTLERLVRPAASAPLGTAPSARRVPLRAAEWAMALGLLAAACAAPFLRSSTPGAVGLTLALALPAVGMWSWARGGWRAAPVGWLAGYAWVARDLEIVALVLTWVLAELAGEVARRLEQSRGDPAAPATDPARRGVRPALVVVLVAFVFALTYLQRAGVNTHIDFTGIDWAAGTFGDTETTWTRIGAVNVGKYMLARGVVYGLCLAPLGPLYRRRVALGLVVVELGRVVLLTLLLFLCKSSFWTSFRVLGDLPHALMAAVVATIACAVVVLGARRVAQAGAGGGLSAVPAAESR